MFALPLAAQNVGASLTNGVDGYLEIPYNPTLVPQAGITIEAWLTYDESTLAAGWRYPTVVRQNMTPQQESYFLRVNANNNNARTLTWKVVRNNGVATNVNYFFGAGEFLTWTHVAATFDGTTAVLYINGNQVGAVAGSTGPIWDRGGALRIGKGDDSGGPIEVWNGELDEVRLWPFARTQAEIRQSMNWQLSSVPGRVSTWSLDGHGLDTSGSNHATQVGTVNFTANPLVLSGVGLPPGIAIGNSTPGCLGPLALTVGSVPVPGNLDFAVVCTRAPANAGAFLAVSFGTAPNPLPVAGIQYFLDLPSSIVAFTTAGPSGAARYPLGLPAFLAPGFGLAFQYAFLDPCGPQGLTASNALVAIVQ